MERIKVRQENDCLVVRQKIGKADQISRLELNILGNREIPGLLPVTVVRGYDGLYWSVSTVDAIPLSRFLRNTISFRRFVELVRQVLKIMQRCQSYGMRTGNLFTEMEYILYLPKRREVRMIYRPLISIQEEKEDSAVFLELGRRFRCRPEEAAIRNRYLRIFQSREKFELFAFEQALENLWQVWVDERREEQKMGGGNSSAAYTLTRQMTGEQIVITSFPFSVGREEGVCDYVVSDNPRVSGRHLIFKRSQGRVYLYDDASRNKTRVNGRVIPQRTNVELRAKVIIEIGGERFLFQPGRKGNCGAMRHDGGILVL